MRLRIAAFLTLSLTASAWGVAPPQAEKSEYLATRSANFLCSANSLFILAAFDVRAKNLAHPLYAVVRFENPTDPAAPFETSASIRVGDKDFQARSPALQSVKADTLYGIDVTLFSDEAHTHVVGRHHQDLLSPEQVAIPAYAKLGCAVQPAVTQPPPAQLPASEPAPNGMAVLYVLNKSGWTMLPHSQEVMDNGKPLTSLPRETYVRLLISPATP